MGSAGSQGELAVARWFKTWMRGSGAMGRKQDAGSAVRAPKPLGCQLQVMCACLTDLRPTKEVLLAVAPSVPDNPTFLADSCAVTSLRIFHSDPVARVASTLPLTFLAILPLSDQPTPLLVACPTLPHTAP
ncbi:aromatic amino acid lyase, partial [Salmonella enterica]|uniref:aromatic amino acid lyase n=1 Tax=Salmonella enterica TaxID=28901 RepID=UPI00398C5A34